MKNGFCRLLKAKPFVYIVLVVVILLQLVNIVYGFSTQKKGFHSDELYSYGLSNSHENPYFTLAGYIYDDDDEYINVNEWISGSTVKDYLVVNDGEAFDYANVWYNQSLDRHPPLYYAVLHTICSFFPNQFSSWFGFSINLVCFTVTQIFLFLLAKKLLKSNWLAVLVCVCYGFSVGAVNTTVFIRMYSMTAMWLLILAYIHLKVKENGNKLRASTLIPLFIIMTLGALTQHEFTVAAYAFAICFCLHYLLSKDIKSFFKYGFTMLGGVLLSWAIFPAMPSQIFSEGGHAVSFRRMGEQIPQALDYIFSELFGLSGIGAAIAAGVLLLIAVACIIIHSKKKEKVEDNAPKQSAINRFAAWFVRINVFYMGMAAVVLFIVATTVHSVIFEYMGYCDRYLFVIYPFVILSVIALVTHFIRAIIPSENILIRRIPQAVLFLALLAVNIVSVSPAYYFPQTDYAELKSKLDGSNVIVLEDIDGALVRFAYFSYCLMDCNEVYYSYFDWFTEHLDSVDSIDSDKPVYIFIYNTKEIDDEEFDGIEDLSFYKAPKELGTVEIHSRKYRLYVME